LLPTCTIQNQGKTKIGARSGSLPKYAPNGMCRTTSSFVATSVTMAATQTVQKER